MSLRATASSAGTLLMAAVVGAALVAVPIIFFVGPVRVAEVTMPVVLAASILTLAVCGFLLLPLAVIPSTRPAGALGLFIASFVFGAMAWFMGLLLAWTLWGTTASILGLWVCGVGVVPVGALAALFHGLGLELGVLVGNVILACALRIGAARLIGALEMRPQRIARSKPLAIPSAVLYRIVGRTTRF